jgi:hypothetical protein
MKRVINFSRPIFYLLMATFVLLGCGLFNSAVTERQEDNAELTSGAVFDEVVMAEGIGSGNAPVNVTDDFNSSQDFIYVVAEAERIKQGTTMFARWFREGEPFEDSSEVTADRDYENTYVEFHLENLADRMEEGDYSVQLFVNGNPAETVEFSVN